MSWECFQPCVCPGVEDVPRNEIAEKFELIMLTFIHAAQYNCFASFISPRLICNETQVNVAAKVLILFKTPILLWQVYLYPFHPLTQSQWKSSSGDKMPEIACFRCKDVSWRWRWQTRRNKWMNKHHGEAQEKFVFQLICRWVQAMSASLDGVCSSFENVVLFVFLWLKFTSLKSLINVRVPNCLFGSIGILNLPAPPAVIPHSPAG